MNQKKALCIFIFTCQLFNQTPVFAVGGKRQRKKRPTFDLKPTEQKSFEAWKQKQQWIERKRISPKDLKRKMELRRRQQKLQTKKQLDKEAAKTEALREMFIKETRKQAAIEMNKEINLKLSELKNQGIEAEPARRMAQEIFLKNAKKSAEENLESNPEQAYKEFNQIIELSSRMLRERAKVKDRTVAQHKEMVELFKTMEKAARLTGEPLTNLMESKTMNKLRSSFRAQIMDLKQQERLLNQQPKALNTQKDITLQTLIPQKELLQAQAEKSLQRAGIEVKTTESIAQQAQENFGKLDKKGQENIVELVEVYSNIYDRLPKDKQYEYSERLAMLAKLGEPPLRGEARLNQLRALTKNTIIGVEKTKYERKLAAGLERKIRGPIVDYRLKWFFEGAVPRPIHYELLSVYKSLANNKDFKEQNPKKAEGYSTEYQKKSKELVRSLEQRAKSLARRAKRTSPERAIKLNAELQAINAEVMRLRSVQASLSLDILAPEGLIKNLVDNATNIMELTDVLLKEYMNKPAVLKVVTDMYRQGVAAMKLSSNPTTVNAVNSERSTTAPSKKATVDTPTPKKDVAEVALTAAEHLTRLLEKKITNPGDFKQSERSIALEALDMLKIAEAIPQEQKTSKFQERLTNVKKQIEQRDAFKQVERMAPEAKEALRKETRTAELAERTAAEKGVFQRLNARKRRFFERNPRAASMIKVFSILFGILALDLTLPIVGGQLAEKYGITIGEHE